jgi:hypothetical protein
MCDEFETEEEWEAREMDAAIEYLAQDPVTAKMLADRLADEVEIMKAFRDPNTKFIDKPVRMPIYIKE